MPAPRDVVIVDYTMGNLFNLAKVVRTIGAEPFITGDAGIIAKASQVILPGVGAFEDGIAYLNKNGLGDALRAFAKTGRPLLGICLGMQLLMENSDEGGLHAGLALVKGQVKRFLDPLPGGEKYKIPHIGWSSLQLPSTRANWDNTVLAQIKPGAHVYFVHSYAVDPSDKKAVLAQTAYGRQVFCCALQDNNISGCQFHPEISGPVGLNILKQFIMNG